MWEPRSGSDERKGCKAAQLEGGDVACGRDLCPEGAFICESVTL